MPPDNKRHGQPEKGPEPLGEILSRMFLARGWGRQQSRIRLERAWAEVAGPTIAPHTAVSRLVRGVLEVIVDSGVLLQELTHFHKRRLLQQLKTHLSGVSLTDLRFRAGVVPTQRPNEE